MHTCKLVAFLQNLTFLTRDKCCTVHKVCGINAFKCFFLLMVHMVSFSFILLSECTRTKWRYGDAERQIGDELLKKVVIFIFFVYKNIHAAS